MAETCSSYFAEVMNHQLRMLLSRNSFYKQSASELKSPICFERNPLGIGLTTILTTMLTTIFTCFVIK